MKDVRLVLISDQKTIHSCSARLPLGLAGSLVVLAGGGSGAAPARGAGGRSPGQAVGADCQAHRARGRPRWVCQVVRRSAASAAVPVGVCLGRGMRAAARAWQRCLRPPAASQPKHRCCLCVYPARCRFSAACWSTRRVPRVLVASRAGVQDATAPAPGLEVGPGSAPGLGEPQTSPVSPSAPAIISTDISALCPSLLRDRMRTQQAAGSGKGLLSCSDVLLAESNSYLEAAEIQAACLLVCFCCDLAGEEGRSSFCRSANPPHEHR